MMNFFRVIILLLLMISVSVLTSAQCDINAGCTDDPVLNIDPPTFDPASLSILLDNIEIGGFECMAPSYQVGMAIYIYQLLPDGSRMTQCAVVNEPPFNVVGSVAIGFGQTSFCSMLIPLGSLTVGPTQGFEACDGAYLEIEAALFATENLAFDPAVTSVYAELVESEYYIVNLGNIEININNEFPGEGQPLTTAKIKDFNSDSEGPMTMACGEDVELYLEGLSRIANCLPYEDISTGISSELINEFYYTINNGEPIIVLDESTGAAGGQLTGPNAELAGLCYAGVLTNENPYRLEFAELPPDLCDGSTIVFTLKTTDVFTNTMAEDQFTVIYTGGTGCGAACAVEPHCDSPCYAEYNPNPAAGSIADPAECLTALDCETIIADGLEATCADVVNCGDSSCPTVYLNDDNLPNLPEALCVGDMLQLCFDIAVDEAIFDANSIEFNYDLLLAGSAATVDLTNSYSSGTAIDANATGQICFSAEIPTVDNVCESYELSLTINTVFYRDADCADDFVAYNLNLTSPLEVMQSGDNLNDLVPLLSIAGLNPILVQVYPNPNWTATLTQAPACDGSTLGIVEVYAADGTLCETFTDLGTAGVDGECPANNADFPEFTYTAFETFVVPDQNDMDSVVVNPCAVNITLPAQTINCEEICDVPGCTNICATNYNPDATEDDDSCTLPDPPATECYETASFNETTCVWDVTGEMPPEPETVCEEIAVFNDDPTVCAWFIDCSNGVCGSDPRLECYETATYNNTTCTFDISGEMPEEPTDLGCFEEAVFNNTTCMWDIIDSPVGQDPRLECYETATFNNNTCIWDISGEMPDPPTDLACYQSVGAFDDETCMWQILGTQPPIDDGCDLTDDSFDEATCMAVNTSTCLDGTSLDEVNCVCIDIPVPGCTNECATNYNPEANQDDGSCTLPEEPSTACYQTATFNNTTCEWDIMGVQPDEPPTACFETAEFDDTSCMWIISGEMPEINDGCDLTADSFDDSTCMPVNTPNCPDGTTFNASACSCDTDPVPGCTEPCATNYDPNANQDDGSCVLPDPDDGCDLTTDSLDENCMIVNTPPDCPADTEFEAATCECLFIDIEGCTNPCASNYNPDAVGDDGSCEYPDPDDNCDITDDNYDTITCEIINTPNCPDNAEFEAATCECVVYSSCCTDPCALNFNPDCTIADGSCEYPDLDDNCDITDDTYDTTTCEIINTPNCPDGTNFNAVECSCDAECVTPRAGSIDCE